MEKISRTEKKRRALSAQELGEKLVDLTEEQIGKIPLPEELLKAVSLARAITKRGGRKRQLQYIGVLMRKMDTAPIQEAVHCLEEGSRQQAERHKLAEHRRDELIGGNDAVLAELSQLLPAAEQEHLKDLIAKARAERMKKMPSPTPLRTLFRYLYQISEGRK